MFFLNWLVVICGLIVGRAGVVGEGCGDRQGEDEDEGLELGVGIGWARQGKDELCGLRSG